MITMDEPSEESDDWFLSRQQQACDAFITEFRHKLPQLLRKPPRHKKVESSTTSKAAPLKLEVKFSEVAHLVKQV